MVSVTAIWVSILLCSIFNLESCYSYVRNRVQIVTYGEPCIRSHLLPIKIEGPKAPQEEQKIPLSLNFRIASDLQPTRRLVYPIAIETPCATSTPSPIERIIEDNLRGKSYAYNAYAPVTDNPPLLPKNYNFAVDVPISTDRIVCERTDRMQVPRMKGLASRVDRILVPACEVST